MNGRIPGEEVPRQTVHQRGARQALLDQEGIVAKGREKLAQPLRHPCLPCHAFQFFPEHRGRDDGAPALLQRRRLLEVGAHLLLEEGTRNDVPKEFPRSQRVPVIDTLDRFLGPDPFLAGKVSHIGRGQGRADLQQCEGDAESYRNFHARLDRANRYFRPWPEETISLLALRVLD